MRFKNSINNRIKGETFINQLQFGFWLPNILNKKLVKMKILILLILVVTLADFGRSDEPPDPSEYVNEMDECIKVGDFMNECNNCKCSALWQPAYCSVLQCSLSRQSQGPSASEFLGNWWTLSDLQDFYFCSAQISESNVLVSDHKKLMENLMQYLKSIFRESFRYLNEKGVCKKKGDFVDYCNKCRCTDVGKPGYCSMKMCPEYSNSLNLPKELSRSKNDRSAVLKLPIQIFNFRRS